MSDSLRRTVHKGTTKIERHHKFAKHLAFGDGGLLQFNDPVQIRRRLLFATNSSQTPSRFKNVVDQTQALHALKSEGASVSHADLAFLSPYPTSKRKRVAQLLITHNFGSQDEAQLNIRETSQPAPHHRVARRRIAGSCEITA